MGTNKLPYIIIALLIAVIAVGAYFILGRGTKVETSGQPTATARTSTAPAGGSLSEQPNMAKYNEYLSDIYLGKMAIGKKIGSDGLPTKTNIFTKRIDQFCTMMTLKKTVPSGGIATAVYDTVAKRDDQPKTTFPMELKAGGSGGCGDLTQSAGKYEYKLYIDNIPVAVLPFEVR